MLELCIKYVANKLTRSVTKKIRPPTPADFKIKIIFGLLVILKASLVCYVVTDCLVAENFSLCQLTERLLASQVYVGFLVENTTFCHPATHMHQVLNKHGSIMLCNKLYKSCRLCQEIVISQVR